MSDVLVLCEGQTEREFCRVVLAPYLSARGVRMGATLAGKPGGMQGGIRSWRSYRGDVLRAAAERPGRRIGLLVDYYGMPASWPGRVEADRLPAAQRGPSIERRLLRDLHRELPEGFHPCIQVHEFESLLFVDPDAVVHALAGLGSGRDLDTTAAAMRVVRDDCGGVECINDSPETAPSKRLRHLIRGYDKVAWGITALRAVPVETLRAGCPWLDRWLTRLCSGGSAA